MQLLALRAQLRLLPLLLFVVQVGSVEISSATAEPRIALVATNQSYVEPIPALAFSNTDGDIITAALTSLEFEVMHVKDASRENFRNSMQQFVERIKAAGPQTLAFFYFSGHAGDDGTRNYLILNELITEVRRTEDLTKAVWTKAAGVPFSEVTNALAELNVRARFVVVDSHLDLDEPSLYIPGQLLATQGRPGLNAADSNNYSRALSGALLTPGLEAEAIFRQVQVKVAEVTNGRQIPFFVNKLARPVVFEKSNGQTKSQRSADDAWLEDPLWGSVRGTNNKSLLEVYLERFAQGKHAEEAKAQIAELDRLASVANKTSGERPPALKGPANLGRRVALVIGNGDYGEANHLKNPVNDAKAIANELSDLGFQTVQQHFDVGREAMVRALKDFGETARGSDWAVIYYAGHGMEVKGVNYLIPVDAKLADEEDVEEEAVAMSRLFDRLRDAGGVKILILDACRNNPFAARMIRRGLSRGEGGKGLAEVQAASGTLIAYATNPGDVASDGVGEHSPYVTALLRHMVEPGLDIRLMFSAVYETVEQETKKRQQPWYAAQLPGRPLVLKPN